MTRLSPEQSIQEWSNLIYAFPAPTLQLVQSLVQKHQEALASHFYKEMLLDAVASQFLTHDQVKDRLHSSMKRWITSLVPVDPGEQLAAVIALQTKVGEVHARIGLPVHLVLRGARSLKQKFLELARNEPELNAAARFDATQLMFAVIDMAMEIMSQVYSSAHDRRSRAEESYRLFSVAQNVAAEKERQRAAHLDWENQTMFDLAVGLNGAQLPRVGASEFGLWFRHKGAHAFEGTAEADLIVEAMQHIDEVLLPMFDLPGTGEKEDRIRLLRELREHSKGIDYHLDRLFRLHNELEAGRDVLTRLLSRKFLPVVLNKEVSYSRTNGSSFALLAIDIDHFKRVNDSHGHEAGDMVLQQFAAMLSNCSRGGDYVFRLGGEEFLMLLVDTTAEGASRVAEKIRREVAEEDFKLPMDRLLKVTISIGLAMHNGHPDYQHTLRLADAALYQAKDQGRNRVVQAAESIVA